MTGPPARDLEYNHDGVRQIGYFVAEPGPPRPALLLVHDAGGVSPGMQDAARRAAALGYAVLLADLWGERRAPRGADEVAAFIGGLVGDRRAWMGRIGAAHAALREQPEVDADRVAAFGYCFGGSSVLEYAREGAVLQGVVTFHAGLETVSDEWGEAAPGARVLILTGAEDPMAPLERVRALGEAMSAAGVEWEVACYGRARHAFTSPHADRIGDPSRFGYDARADRRSWGAFTIFLEEVFAEAGGLGT